MEQEQLPIAKNSSQIVSKNHYNTLNSLYKKTHQTLCNYNPTDNQTITSIFQILDTTTQLQIDGCNEMECGKFAYQQHILQRAPMAPYISLFFKRIAKHNARMKDNNFTPSTLEQFIQYRKIPLINEAIEESHSFDLGIKDEIDSHTAEFLDSYNKTTNSLSEYENLLQNITKMLTLNPEKTKLLADLIYGPKL
jgi:hypothetical protein